MSRMIYWPLPILILLLSILSTAQAERVRIFEIRKNLPMSSSETVFKDYYLTGGRDVGLKENMIVTVYRMQPIHDHAHNEARGNFKFRVGQLKLIWVTEQNSVARGYRLTEAKVAPILELEAFQVGDVVELTDAYFEKANASSTDNESGSENSGSVTPTPSTAANPDMQKIAQTQERAPSHVVDLKAGTAEPAPAKPAAPSATQQPVAP